MSCTPNHILIELGESRREKGRMLMSSEKVDGLFREGTERIAELERINAKLLGALEATLFMMDNMTTAAWERGQDLPIREKARDAIREATE